MLHHGHRPSHTLSLTIQREFGGFYIVHTTVEVVSDGIHLSGVTDRFGKVSFTIVPPTPPPARLSLVIDGSVAAQVPVNWVMPSTDQHVLI